MSPGNGELAFTMTVDSVKQNYLTIRMWGSDNNGTTVNFQQSLTNVNPIDMGATPPPFPGRFYYETMPITLALTQGKTSLQMVLYESGMSGSNGRPIYSAFTHTDPHFIPDGSNPTGSKPTLIGQLPTTSALTLSQVVSILQTNRQAIYGSGGYYNSILARQVQPGTSGAPKEVIGLDMYNPVANFTGTTPDQWRDACGSGQHGPGYSTVPDEMLSVLTATYLLPPFTDANGNVVSGLDHYHDSTIIQRIVECLDGTSYLQSTDGHYQNEPYNSWNGLTSTPRATGHDYAGLTTRGQGWSITLEGADTDCLGRTILSLLNDSTAAPVFKSYLSQSYDADLNGGSMLRANAYERMLNNQLTFTYSVFGVGTVSQGLFSTNATYINTVALAKLQALYPYSVTNTNFPASTIYPGSNYTFPYPDVSGSLGVTLLEQMTGAVASTSLMTNLYTSAGTSYAISSAGFGEAHGSLSGGYDGRYGTILPWMVENLATFAGFDSNAAGTPLSLVKAQAKHTADAYLRFISPEENYNGATDNFTLAQEDYITYRDPYSPNADCRVFNVGAGYPAADPNRGINSALELRGAYLEAVYGVTPLNTIGYGNKGGENSLCYLETLASYENTLRSLVNVNPSTLTMLPGEPGASNSAFVDPQTGSTAIYFNGERFYMTANWRNWEYNNNSYGARSEIAPIHDTTSTVDRAGIYYLPYSSATQQSDGNLSSGSISQPWVMRYGNWLVAGNPTTSSSSVTLPAGTGQALDVVGNGRYGMGSTVTVPAGGAVALNMPIQSTTQPIANGTYVLTNIYSQLLLDCPGGAPTNGLQIDQASLPSGVNSQWVFTYTGSGYYTVKNVASGLYLTSSTSQGSALVQQPADSGKDQSWQLIQSGDSYVLLNQASGLDANDPGGSVNPGTGMIVWSQDAGLNSDWKFQAVASAQLVANGFYTMTSSLSNLLADNIGSSQTSGQVMDQQVANGGLDQQWIFTYAGNGYYTIQNAASGLYLTPAGVVGNFSYPYLLQETYSPGNTWQLWTVFPSDAGYSIVNEGTGNVACNQYSGPATTLGMDTWQPGNRYTWVLQPVGVTTTYLKFDEGTGATAADATGNGWTGTLFNTPTWVAGLSLNAVDLNGSNQYVTLPTGLVSSLTNCTISMWANLDAVPTWSRLFDFGTGTSDYMFLTTNSGSTIRFAISNGGNAYEQRINGTTTFPIGGWHHVAVTLAGATGTLYVDGTQVGQNTSMTLNPSSLGSTNLNYIGRSQYSDPYLNGVVDEFRIYNQALTASQITSLIANSPPGLVSAPTSLSGRAGSKQAVLTWTASAGATGYEVLRATTSGGPYSTVANNVTTTTYTDTGLTTGTTYYYTVAAYSGTSESPNATQVSVTSQ